jgi:hypothetical protein
VPLRSGLLRILLAYAGISLLIASLAFRRSTTGLGAVIGGGALLLVVPSLLRRPIRRAAIVVHRGQRRALRSLACGVGVAAALASVLGATAESVAALEDERVRTELGPVDVAVAFDSEQARSAASVQLVALRRDPSSRLTDADPLAIDLVDAQVIDGLRVVLLGVPTGLASGFGGRAGETGIPDLSLAINDALVAGIAQERGPLRLQIAGSSRPFQFNVVRSVPANGIIGAARRFLPTTVDNAGGDTRPIVIVDPSSIPADVARARYLLLSAPGDAVSGALLAAELATATRDALVPVSSVPVESEVTRVEPDPLVVQPPTEPDPLVVSSEPAVTDGTKVATVVDVKSELESQLAGDRRVASRRQVAVAIFAVPFLVIGLGCLVFESLRGTARNAATVRLFGLSRSRLGAALSSLPWAATTIGLVAGSVAGLVVNEVLSTRHHRIGAGLVGPICFGLAACAAILFAASRWSRRIRDVFRQGRHASPAVKPIVGLLLAGSGSFAVAGLGATLWDGGLDRRALLAAAIIVGAVALASIASSRHAPPRRFATVRSRRRSSLFGVIVIAGSALVAVAVAAVTDVARSSNSSVVGLICAAIFTAAFTTLTRRRVF